MSQMPVIKEQRKSKGVMAKYKEDGVGRDGEGLVPERTGRGRCGDQNTYALARPPSVLIAWLSLERVCACRPPGSMVARACVCVLTEAGLLVPPVNSTA